METNSAPNEEVNEAGLVFRIFCWYYTWILTPWRLLCWRTAFWMFALLSSSDKLEERLRLYLEARVSISKHQLGDEAFTPWLRSWRVGARAFWLADYLEAKVKNAGVGGFFHSAHELGLIDETAQALEFFEATDLGLLFDEARALFRQHLQDSGELQPWPEFAKKMGSGVLDEQHDGLTSRFFAVLQNLPARRVEKIRQAPRLFI